MTCGQRAACPPVADWFERAAVGASMLCLIHCIGLPLLLAALPALSRLIALPESFHVWVLGFALPTSGAALLLGHRGHRAYSPAIIGGVGLALLAVGALFVSGNRWETPATIIGSACLIFAHLSNWRLRHRRHRHG
jgi:hypothetical protein